MGESPVAEDYRERAGHDFEEFAAVLKAEEELDYGLAGPEPSPFPMPFGAYTLLSELGRGAVGVVYEAVHRELGRTVALKVLKSGFDTHPSAIERFRREARACAQVRHDNIVEIYEAGEQDGRHFYAMALLEGHSLKELARDGKLPEPRELAKALAEVADALHSLHTQGIVHRDIKPANIMVEPGGRMVLADFGLARTVASEKLTQTGESLGTPLYMSPEQLLGDQDKIDGRTDVYGFGASLYEILAGRPVFKVGDVSALMRMILAERPDDLRGVAQKVPESLSRIVMKALEKRRRDRYDDAAAMRDDLLAFARGDEVKGRPVSGTQHALRAVRRQWKWLAAAVILLAAGLTWKALQPPPPVPNFTLTVASIPSATVFLNDEEQGQTRALLEVEAGEYKLVLKRPGFEPRERVLRIDADRDLELMLRPKDPTDPTALAELANAVDVQMEEWDEMPRTRGGPGEDGTLEVLFPRGNVRKSDAASYLIHIGDDFEGEGALVFRSGTQELHRREIGDWPERTGETSTKLPETVMAALEAGQEITWSFLPKSGKAVTATFKLAKTNAESRIAKLNERLKGFDQTVIRQINAQIYLEEGLALAAYREAHGVAKAKKAPKAALAVMRAALEKMGLEGSPLWDELQLLANG